MNDFETTEHTETTETTETTEHTETEVPGDASHPPFDREKETIEDGAEDEDDGA